MLKALMDKTKSGLEKAWEILIPKPEKKAEVVINNWKSTRLFVGLGLLGLCVVIFKPYLSSFEQFYLRIFIGLSAAGIAAIIPGFFEIKSKFLNSTFRASGAIAIFILIYTHNPPEILALETMEQLKGEWHYDVHPTSSELGYGSRHYGGTANVQIGKNNFGQHVSIAGALEWRFINGKKENIPPHNTWHSISGGITGNDKLIYQYQAMDYGKAIYGFINYSIIRNEEGKITKLVGNFYRTTKPFVQGTISMTRNGKYYENIESKPKTES